MVDSYQTRYTWSHFKNVDGEALLQHRDGCVSVAFTWSGIDTTMKETPVIQDLFNEIYGAMGSLPENVGLFIENHFFRKHNGELAEKYLQYGEDNIVRDKEFAMMIREEQAKLIYGMSVENELITVLTFKTLIKPIDKMFPKRALDKRKKDGVKLVDIARRFMSHLSDAKFLSAHEIEQAIWYSYYRDKENNDEACVPNPRFELAQRIATMPVYDNGLLRVGQTYTKVLLLVDYPDSDVNWFLRLAKYASAELHVTQIIEPFPLDRSIQKSTSTTKSTLEGATAIGGELMAGKVKDLTQYRAFVSENDLKVFKNAYIIKMHGDDPKELKENAHELTKLLGAGTVVSGENENIEMAMWRFSQIAQGHKSSFMREDHTLQVGNMAPVIKFSRGDEKNLQMLRITDESQPICLSYPKDGINHAITIAKTGSGKGVDTVTAFAELYPLGYNIFGVEIGASYKWLVEAFGGDYFHLDSETVVSPFPAYALANRDNKDQPLHGDIANPLVEILMPLLEQGHKDIYNHIEAVAGKITMDMYRADPVEGRIGPTLANFYEMAEKRKGDFEGSQDKALRAILENVDSFLSHAGKNFANADSINFEKGICFADFNAIKSQTTLAKMLLSFILTRYDQIGFATKTPTIIPFDEMHEFSAMDKALVGRSIRVLSRMGRKEATYFHGITQEMHDIEVDAGVLNQIDNKNFLYMESGHEDIASQFKLNDVALGTWKGFLNPKPMSGDIGFRQNLRMSGGNQYNLYLKSPKMLLNLADTSPLGLELKEKIGAQTKDPIKRIQLLSEAMARGKL